jgi:uncharacterized membrane protein YkoI
MKTERWLVVRIPSVMLIATSMAMAETSVKLADLPHEVQKAVKEQMAGATLRGLSKETEHGKTTYEAELTVNGKSKDITLDGEGKIIEVEEEVQLVGIPEGARGAIEVAAGKAGKVLMVESVKENDKLVAYEAHIQKQPNGKKSEVRVDASGKPAAER